MLETLSYTKAGSLILYKKQCGERQNRSVLAHAMCGWPERKRYRSEGGKERGNIVTFL